MLGLKKIAVTGGLASGKTSVCQVFKNHGAYVVNADEIVHRLLSPNTQVGKQIVAQLGEEIIKGNELDRAKIAKKVFQNPQQLQAVEHVLHPSVIRTIEEEYDKAAQRGSYAFFVAEIPLLYEIGKEDFFDTVIAVIASDETCRQRFSSQGDHSAEEWDQRMSRQLSQTAKQARAPLTIRNEGTLKDLESQVMNIIKELTT